MIYHIHKCIYINQYLQSHESMKPYYLGSPITELSGRLCQFCPLRPSPPNPNGGPRHQEVWAQGLMGLLGCLPGPQPPSHAPFAAAQLYGPFAAAHPRPNPCQAPHTIHTKNLCGTLAPAARSCPALTPRGRSVGASTSTTRPLSCPAFRNFSLLECSQKRPRSPSGPVAAPGSSPAGRLQPPPRQQPPALASGATPSIGCSR